MSFFGDIGGLGGVGSALSAATGIAGLFQNRKNAKFQRRMAKMNFDLQKEYAAKNYDLQVAAQDMQRYQFQEMMGLQDPSTKRKMLEDAGFNPFMDQGGLGSVSSSGSTAGSVGSVMPPQYDVNSVLQSEQLRQSNLTSTIGSITQLLDAMEKIGTVDNVVAQSKVKSNVAKATEQASIDIVNNQAVTSSVESAMAELHLEQYPQELQASLQKLLYESNLLDSQALLNDVERGRVREQTSYIKQQKLSLIQSMSETFERITGLKLDNEQKRAFNRVVDSMYQWQLKELQSRVAQNYASARQAVTQSSLNEANTRLAHINGFWAGMPQTYDQYVYANNQQGVARPLGIHIPGSLGDVLRTTRLLDNAYKKAQTDFTTMRQGTTITDLLLDNYDKFEKRKLKKKKFTRYR